MKELPESYSERCEELLKEECEKYDVNSEIVGAVLVTLNDLLPRLFLSHIDNLELEKPEWRESRRYGKCVASLMNRIEHDTQLNAQLEEAMING